MCFAYLMYYNLVLFHRPDSSEALQLFLRSEPGHSLQTAVLLQKLLLRNKVLDKRIFKQPAPNTNPAQLHFAISQLARHVYFPLTSSLPAGFGAQVTLTLFLPILPETFSIIKLCRYSLLSCAHSLSLVCWKLDVWKTCQKLGCYAREAWLYAWPLPLFVP